MIYLITEQKIKTFKTLEEVELQENIKIDENELKTVGNDYVIKLTNKDLDFCIDKYNLSKIALSGLYGGFMTPKQKKIFKKLSFNYFLFATLGISVFLNIAFLIGTFLCVKF